jgi:putative membrane protein
MAGFVLRVLIVALGLWLASELVPGIEVEGGATLFGAALLLGIVNAVIRPIVVVLFLPITILTLGLFLLVINAAMLGLVASLFDGFRVAGFGSAILGSIVLSITGWITSWLIGPWAHRSHGGPWAPMTASGEGSFPLPQCAVKRWLMRQAPGHGANSRAALAPGADTQG